MADDTMVDEKIKGGVQAGAAVKNSRRDRLKLALRQNLKRRKSQARAAATEPPSNDDDVPPHDARGEKPGK
jgi:hypothetical protein